ncbi:MAG: hypothetical protein B6D71_08875 [gamma proteobacterium symbiont of Stewartia floridana]|nr:MAG: hypothetical protein B6D71_08875 [gamma proteobacterium symbiont of Stewartia floridana]
MKIIVYNSSDQYALSRKQIEKIKEALPNEYFEPIQEFHLTHSMRGSERFEYLKEEKQAHFCYPVEQKSKGTTDEAVSELLLGLVRIKSNTKWGHPLSRIEREGYMGFIEMWHSKCLSEIS